MLKPVLLLEVVFVPEADDPIFATCVPAKAKKRNIMVPVNSPIVATKSGNI